MNGWLKYTILLQICVTIAILLSGCLPKGCFGKLGELKDARPTIQQGTITEEGPITSRQGGPLYYKKPGEPDTGIKKGGISYFIPPPSPCTNELDTIRANGGPQVLI